jgi:parallel beta-helix repeat protein
MRASRRTFAVLLSVVPLLSFGVVEIALETPAVAATAPGTVNELVSPSGSASAASCPTGIKPTVGSYATLPLAIAAAAAGNTIYVCAGTYDLSATTGTPATYTYSAGEDVVVNKSLTIDGPNWNAPPSGSDTLASVNSSTQAILMNGAGVFVEAANVQINGLTFLENNFENTTFDNGGSDCTTAPFGDFACGSSIDVQSFVNGENDAGTGDQGESDVDIDNNLFVDTGGDNTYQGGVVHFGLGQEGAVTDVTALDSGDIVDGNVFYQGSGFENNAVQMSDTNGAVVDANTVNYPADDDSSISALWFPGFDNATQVENNSLNGGNIDSDSGASINTEDPKSGIKFVDLDVNGIYGVGCADQVVSNNTISGFVDDINMVSIGYDATGTNLCPVGPSHFTVSNNKLSNARLYGVFVFGSTTGTISGNVVANTDTEGYNGPNFNLLTDTSANVSYVDGEYDYLDADPAPVANSWTSDTGNGYSFPYSIEGNLPPGVTTTTTTLPLVTTTTTVPIEPAVAASGARLRASSVSTTVSCTGAPCVGTLELSKTVTTKVQIRHTKRYRTRRTIENLGLTRYSLLVGQSKSLTVRLNAKGLSLERSSASGRLPCTLSVTSATGVLREIVTFRRP